MLNLRPWLNNLTIKTTSLEMRRFNLDYVDPDPQIGDWGWAQRPYIAEIERQYNSGKPVRIIVLKARQLGISTATEAVLFLWAFFHRGTNSLVLSYEDGQAQELFQMTKTYWDTWPHRHLYTLQYSTKRQLRWLETRSQVRVATAKNIGGARGSTVHALHASEVAFWPDPEPLWTGLNQTIPSRHQTFVCLESTANGVGNWFHEMWQKAEQGESEFTPLFFPWFRHSAYRLRTTLCTQLELSPEEKHIYGLAATLLIPDNLIYESIAWRRWAINNKTNGDVQYFMQEYPSTPEEAFITSGNPIFTTLALSECFDRKTGVTGRLYRNGVGKVVFKEDPSGPLTVFVKPSTRNLRSDLYFISGDPSETVAGDPACMQVLNRRTYEQVAVYHDHCDPQHFARQMILLGEYYNHGMLCPEIEGGGQAVIAFLMANGYDNLWADKRPDRYKSGFNVYGWSTNMTRKNWAIGKLQSMIIDKSLLIHDIKTYNQLVSFVRHEDGYMGNINNSVHDDAVMALAIGVTASEREGAYMSHESARPNPILDLYQSEKEWENGYSYDNEREQLV